ncbi:SMI1/KNR4 family protein [Micromonospora aurantiaca (nom. illeg.)]|uniref:hypothetical protein n=1 Tax=Micromonospora aurantiaca (nom. illeg.) TaxID=47850 RepID=UPI0037B8AB9D
MMNGAGIALGIEAARRLAELDLVDIRPGLTDAEFVTIERRFGLQFADDHRAFSRPGCRSHLATVRLVGAGRTGASWTPHLARTG